MFPSPRGGELILVVFAIAGIVFLAFPSPRGGELIRWYCCHCDVDNRGFRALAGVG